MQKYFDVQRSMLDACSRASGVGCSFGKTLASFHVPATIGCVHGAELQPEVMKIGITCYPTVGGSGILATALGEELARRGHEVHFISYERPFRICLLYTSDAADE